MYVMSQYTLLVADRKNICHRQHCRQRGRGLPRALLRGRRRRQFCRLQMFFLSAASNVYVLCVFLCVLNCCFLLFSGRYDPTRSAQRINRALRPSSESPAAYWRSTIRHPASKTEPTIRHPASKTTRFLTGIWSASLNPRIPR